MPSRKTTTFRFSSDIAENVCQLGEKIGETPEEVLVRAVGTYKYLVNEIMKGSVVIVHRGIEESSAQLDLELPGIEPRNVESFIVPTE
jgi:hypothetical protein